MTVRQPCSSVLHSFVSACVLSVHFSIGDEQPTSSKMTKEEKDTQEKQIFGMHQAHSDFVARLENTLENELQCGICSELIVFVRNTEMEA